MIKEYLVCVAVAVGWSVYQYNKPPPPLTPDQLQQKAKIQSRVSACERMKSDAKYKRLCGEGGEYGLR
jgi:hypothetical protein